MIDASRGTPWNGDQFMSADGKVQTVRSLMLAAILICMTPITCRIASGKAAPVDPCSVLPATELNAVLGQQFGPPSQNPLPPAVANGVTGNQCIYHALAGSPRTVTLIIYFDGSDADAESNLAQLAKFFHPTKTLTGIADAAYLDANNAVHARAGRARYYINVTTTAGAPPSEPEKNLRELTAYVAAQVK
jgi:hypothetical protein